MEKIEHLQSQAIMHTSAHTIEMGFKDLPNESNPMPSSITNLSNVHHAYMWGGTSDRDEHSTDLSQVQIATLHDTATSLQASKGLGFKVWEGGCQVLMLEGTRQVHLGGNHTGR